MFSQKTIDFLVENHLQNSKEWYAANKADYLSYVFEPLAELVTALTPCIHEIDEQLICEPKVDKSISRIYRDTRFSKDKSFYRDVMWCVFIRDKKLYEGPPAFFFELSPKGFRYGCGYYMADAISMNRIRELILNSDLEFKKALAAYEGQNIFKLQGDLYKKSRYPEMPDNLKTWLDRKNIYFEYASQDFEALFSNNLSAILAEGFKILKPVYYFLIKSSAHILKDNAAIKGISK